jgi:predicted NUDIX family NTP pyrophosphohydrolase
VAKSKSVSAGLLLYRFVDGRLEVLIGHMGGPFWTKKDAGGWSIPKGELGEGEDPLLAARREFEEETGSPPPDGPTLELGEVRQASGKRVIAWAIEGDLDPGTVKSNTFVMEWPPKSGRQAEFPEIDRVAWVDVATAGEKLVRGQARFVELLDELVRSPADDRTSRTP